MAMLATARLNRTVVLVLAAFVFFSSLLMLSNIGTDLKYTVLGDQPKPSAASKAKQGEKTAAPIDNTQSSGQTEHQTSDKTPEKNVPENSVPEKRRFVLLLPETSPGDLQCATAAAAMALGYPAPTIVNWQKDAKAELGATASSHHTKVTGLLNYLEQMMRPSAVDSDRLDENDIVIMMDSRDCWFQVTPDVLLQRYHDTNREANRKMQEQWGTDSTVPYKQTIIVSSQKLCWGGLEGAGLKLHCKEVPESPLRKDLYGERTDKETDTHRPASANSGVIIGPAGDMRRYLSKVRATLLVMMAHEEKSYYNDQGLFGFIWARQEMWRRAIRKDGKKAAKALEKDAAFGMAKEEFEYSVGLDYYQDLSMPLGRADWDGDFIAFSNKSGIEQESKDRDIIPTRLQGLPEDIAKSKNPLDEIAKPSEAKVGWQDLPIFADFYKGNVPAIIHMNTFIGERKGWKRTKWHKPWFFPYLRDLLERTLARTGQPLEPLGRIQGAEGESLEYYAMDSSKDSPWPRVFKEGAYKDPMKVLPFEEFCVKDAKKEKEEPWHQTLFQDGKGPLTLEDDGT